MDVIIIGAGIGGLTLALMLEKAGIPFRVYESAQEIRPIGVGISILPHASRELTELGLLEALAEVAVTARESCFFNRFGQLVYKEPVGTFAGYDYPQFQIHRGDLQQILYRALVDRAGLDCVVASWKCVAVEQGDGEATARFVDSRTGEDRPARQGEAIVGCDSIHSIVRRKLVPDDGPPIYSGVNMWRGTTWWKPYLTGASYVRAGWLAHGKLVIYPIRNKLDAEGRQLINWVAEIETSDYHQQDWARPDPRRRCDPRISDGRQGSAFPLELWPHHAARRRGTSDVSARSNGAGQAILDARALADSFASGGDVAGILKAYEDKRLEATASVVRANRTTRPTSSSRRSTSVPATSPSPGWRMSSPRTSWRRCRTATRRVAGYDKATVAARRRA
ncbi:FAD-dependent monooxygenase [Aminobacter sp. Piv2-1]|uniref:FAD-dependent monooxygenase n=1 Tax=Aminobacter sp. Piv2-1 TaxID=3031122 RepID=UPI0030B17F1D